MGGSQVMKMRHPWDSSSRRVRPVHRSPIAPSCQFSIQGGGDMRAITNIAMTMPVTRPAPQRKLLHWAAARLAPRTNGARKAARTRKRPRFRRSQTWVSSSYFLAAPSPAFLDLRGCNMATSMSPARASCGRNGQSGMERAPRHTLASRLRRPEVRLPRAVAHPRLTLRSACGTAMPGSAAPH